MVLESTMVCIDDSDFMRNEDFSPNRLYFQRYAVAELCRSKARSHPENDVGLLTLASGEVLATLTNDIGHIMIKLYKVQPNGEIKLIHGLKLAHFALKHREGKHHKMRIVLFVGSPIENEEEELVAIAKKLRKEKVNVDVVAFGEEATNFNKLETFVNYVNGKEGNSSHLLMLPTGLSATDVLMSSPIMIGEDTMQPHRYEFDDPEEDPDLAMALLISMQEFRQREEEEEGKVFTSNENVPEENQLISLPNATNVAEQPEWDLQKLSTEKEINAFSSNGNDFATYSIETLEEIELLKALLESVPSSDPNTVAVIQVLDEMIRVLKEKQRTDEEGKNNKENDDDDENKL
ncbi:unnamed protein product [Phyllotreta striolata]|uniref:26S proteasome non-ATPase regulatory subunit 4 n=1 Tax=Phyllotreta striolata TaxID=444603 RepID=A0A9N9TRI4_PHYSR|nr:unnamed protein product [Phyllotreta striolata]